jgi:uncharacterized protein Yka (UPF0111/DUF47 family)
MERKRQGARRIKKGKIIPKEKTGILILEGLEQLGVTVQKSSTKADINNLVERVDKILKEQLDVTYGMELLKHKFQEEVGNLMVNLKAETDHLKEEIKSLDNILKSVNNYVSGISNSHTTLQEGLKETTTNIHKSINDSKSSYGFWTFFLFFQIIFAVNF